MVDQQLEDETLKILKQDKDNRAPSESRILVQLLKSLKFFQDRKMKERDIQETSYGLQHQSYKKHEKVVRFGEKGNTFYIIVRGQCTVWLPLPSGVNKILAAKLYGATSQNEDVGFTTDPELPKIDKLQAQVYICSQLKQAYGSIEPNQLARTVSFMSKAHKLVKMNQSSTNRAALLFSHSSGREDSFKGLSDTRPDWQKKVDGLRYQEEFELPQPQSEDVERISLNHRFTWHGQEYEYSDGTYFVRVAQLSSGDAFGEHALISASEIRNATIACSTNCDFACLDKENFQKSLRAIETRHKLQMSHLLHTIPCLMRLNNRAVMFKLISHLVKVKYKRNVVVYRQNDPVTGVYIVKKGEFALTRALVKPQKHTRLSSLIGSRNRAEQNVLVSRLSEIKDVPLVQRLALYGPGAMSGEEDLASGQHQFQLKCISFKGTLFRIDSEQFAQLESQALVWKDITDQIKHKMQRAQGDHMGDPPLTEKKASVNKPKKEQPTKLTESSILMPSSQLNQVATFQSFNPIREHSKADLPQSSLFQVVENVDSVRDLTTPLKRQCVSARRTRQTFSPRNQIKSAKEHFLATASSARQFITRNDSARQIHTQPQTPNSQQRPQTCAMTDGAKTSRNRHRSALTALKSQTQSKTFLNGREEFQLQMPIAFNRVSKKKNQPMTEAQTDTKQEKTRAQEIFQTFNSSSKLLSSQTAKVQRLSQIVNDLQKQCSSGKDEKLKLISSMQADSWVKATLTKWNRV